MNAIFPAIRPPKHRWTRTPYGIPVRNFADAYTGFTQSNAVLVKIHTDEGYTGIGEACAWEPEFYGETLESVNSTIMNYAAPKLLGEDPSNVADTRASFRWRRTSRKADDGTLM